MEVEVIPTGINETVKKLQVDVATLTKEGSDRQQALVSLEQKVNQIEQQIKIVES